MNEAHPFRGAPSLCVIGLELLFEKNGLPCVKLHKREKIYKRLGTSNYLHLLQRWNIANLIFRLLSALELCIL
jgi:hypothetical protein